VQAKLHLRVRGPSAGGTSCWATGAAVKFFVEELQSPFEENGTNSDCGTVSSGPANSRWPGPSATTHARGKYEGSPSPGDGIDVDLTAMVAAAQSAGKTELSVRLIAVSATEEYDENRQARRVGFDSRHTTTAPYLELKFAA
jgi:hypothetical protein